MAASQRPAPKKHVAWAKAEPPSPQTPQPPLTDCLPGDLSSLLGDGHSLQTEQTAAPFALSQCEYVDNALCVNHRPGHVGTRPHLAHLSSWLAYRGVVNVRDLLRRHGVPAVQSVAQELDELEAGGTDWKARANNPGGLIHHLIKVRADDSRPSH